MTQLIPVIVPWFVAGTVLGGLHMATLRWSIGLFTSGRSAWLAFAVQLLRLAVVGGALAAVTLRSGAVPLLAMAAGLLVVRTIMVRLAARA
jgi:F1F0 ATPase subunit 2